MAVPESVAYEVIALHLQWRADRVDTETFIESIERVVADIESDEDVFELVLQLGSVAAGAVAASAVQLGRSPEQLLQETALLSAVEADDETDDED
jgi:hypothetical protein